MVAAPVTTRSTIFYQVFIFFVLQLWAIMAFEVAQYQMVTLYETPIEWIGWGSLLFITQIPMLALLAWKLKTQVQLVHVNWEFKIREVSIDEYTQMVKRYNRAYDHLIVKIDVKLLTLMIACYFGELFLPFILMRTNVLVISLTPIIIAIFIILSGLLFSYFAFRAIPNSATPEFPYHDPSIFTKVVNHLLLLPGIYWSGVRLTMGGAGGFFTLRDPHPVARIEGIEGAVRFDCSVNQQGELTRIVSLFESETSKEKGVICEIAEPITAIKIMRLIKDTINKYIELRGGEDLLEEVLLEIDSYLITKNHQITERKSNDGLISFDDKDHPMEERT